jgi:GNAT superfamily N-acetyltransferase
MRTGGPTIRVVDDGDDAGLGLVRNLFRSYADEFADSIAETLCFQGFEAELAGLPGRYAPPSGCLLMAMENDVPAGCVALRDLGDGTGEMKRLYLPPSHRGRGAGRLLVEEVVRRAGRMGYRRWYWTHSPRWPGLWPCIGSLGVSRQPRTGNIPSAGPSSWRGRSASRAALSKIRPSMAVSRTGLDKEDGWG